MFAGRTSEMLFAAAILVILQLIGTSNGDLEAVLGRCCLLGNNWARQKRLCATFPGPVPDLAAEQQSVCLTSASVCCLRYYREQQCSQGRSAAQTGLDCLRRAQEGGEYFKDCCDGCKLGLMSGSMGMPCTFTAFQFGYPWDTAYTTCCTQAASVVVTEGGGSGSFTSTPGIQTTNGITSITDTIAPSGGDLCAMFPGELCSQECISTDKSYRCACRSGFTLSQDQKTCLQDQQTDRCLVNNPCAHICQDTGISVECSCNPGFQLAQDQRSCKDVDECAEGSDSCDWSSQSCVNSVGSFRCIDREPDCNFGYRFDTEKRACVDINECKERTHLCAPLEVCINSEGGYKCNPSIPKGTVTTSTTTTESPEKNDVTNEDNEILAPQCPDGFEYNYIFRSCRDINECNTNPCDLKERCENTQGSYRCDCDDGFRRDTLSGDCTDINECQLGSNICQGSQRCDNTIGSYTCIRLSGCGTGYTLNRDTGQCEDDDECALGTANCEAAGPQWMCVNTDGSFRCRKRVCPSGQLLGQHGRCTNLTCSPGYRPSDKYCIDINECEEGSPCESNNQCINNPGSYFCRPLLQCEVGYKMNELGTRCVDIDECTDGTAQCGSQRCTNRPGGYVCQCDAGYRLNPQRQCEDINECQSYFGNICSNNAECENTPGSFRCICKPGFKHSTQSDLRTCQDVDECEEIENICHHNCVNIWGSHQCTCNSGFSLATDNRTCIDIDECDTFRGIGRLCIGVCVNTPGSYECACPDGYTLGSDGRTCKDINECEGPSECRSPNEQCVNTRGGFRCEKINCPANYILDTQHKNRCKKHSLYCREDDEECRKQPLSYSYNFLPLVSNLTLPQVGKVDLFTMRGPLWTSTTVHFTLELEEVRASEGVKQATREYFHLKRTSFNQAVISLVRPIKGPQEVQLALLMQLYHNGAYGGSAVAKLIIYVSEYDF